MSKQSVTVPKRNALLHLAEEPGALKRIAGPALGALAAGLTTLTYYSYLRDIRAARARISSGSQLVHTPCGSIEYAVAGEGPPILVVHGAGGGFDQGLQFARPLIDNGFKVIAVSRFGYLRTPLPPEASPIVQADAYAHLLDALKLPKVAVLGGSAGAPSAMQFCLRYPERCSAMILLVPLAFAPRAANEPRQKPSMLAQFVMNTTLRSDFFFWLSMKFARDVMMKTILGTPPNDFKNTNRSEQARVLQVLRNILPVSAREKGLWNDAAVAASLPRYELERFKVPTLVVSVENDLYGTFESARYTAEHIPGARFLGYPTGGHLGVGHEQDTWPEIADFLLRQTNASPVRLERCS